VSLAAWAPERRDIIWINCNPRSGREMKDIHPMLVFSPRAFNERTGIVIGLPMTTASYNDTNPFAIKFRGPKNIASYILVHQPKSFDWRARGAKAHPWKQAPDEVFSAACEQLNQIIQIAN
jgi:mRNA interferase MazF